MGDDDEFSSRGNYGNVVFYAILALSANTPDMWLPVARLGSEASAIARVRNGLATTILATKGRSNATTAQVLVVASKAIWSSGCSRCRAKARMLSCVQAKRWLSSRFPSSLISEAWTMCL